MKTFQMMFYETYTHRPSNKTVFNNALLTIRNDGYHLASFIDDIKPRKKRGENYFYVKCLCWVSSEKRNNWEVENDYPIFDMSALNKEGSFYFKQLLEAVQKHVKVKQVVHAVKYLKIEI